MGADSPPVKTRTYGTGLFAEYPFNYDRLTILKERDFQLQTLLINPSFILNHGLVLTHVFYMFKVYNYYFALTFCA